MSGAPLTRHDDYANQQRLQTGCGSLHGLCVFDEIGAFSAQKARRLYEELTPPPSEASAWLLIVTYAGFLGEAVLLKSIYQSGMAGRRVDNELECYENDELFLVLEPYTSVAVARQSLL